jgi:hypothetical protein
MADRTEKLELALERIVESAERVIADPKCAGVKSVMCLCGTLETFGKQFSRKE